MLSHILAFSNSTAWGESRQLIRNGRVHPIPISGKADEAEHSRHVVEDASEWLIIRVSVIKAAERLFIASVRPQFNIARHEQEILATMEVTPLARHAEHSLTREEQLDFIDHY